MEYVIKALDLYNEAVKNGVADINGKLKSRTEADIGNYKQEIEDITGAIENSKEYIKTLKAQRANVSKEEKDYIDNVILIETERIKEMKSQIKTIKGIINNTKPKLGEFVDRDVLINKGLSGALKDLNEEDENILYSYKLWYERTGEDLPPEVVDQKKGTFLNRRLEIQAKKILETKAAYDALVAVYGSAHTASVEMENQLLSECVVYEQIKDSINELNKGKEYSPEQVSGIVYNMNDYLKNNYKVLKDAGFSDEVIYAAARGSSGYDEYLKSVNKKNNPVPTESGVVTQAEGVVEGLNEKFSGVTINFASGVETTVTNLITNVSEILKTALAQVPQGIKNNVNSVQNNNVTNNYTVNGAGDGNIYSSINALKNLEALKKARGVI